MPSETGYPFPDPFDPGEFACIRVYVPKHSVYYSAFWTAYEYFTLWIAWARDPLKTGKKVAALWRIGWEQARREFDLTLGECVMSIISIRSAPLNPCQIQYQTDDGVWHDGPNMSCCGGGGGGGACGAGAPLRVGADGSVEAYDAGSGTWSNTAPGEDQTTSDGMPAAYPNVDDGRCLAATNYSHKVLDFLERLLDAASTGAAYSEWAAGAVIGLLTLFGNPLPILQELFGLAIGVLNAQQPVIADRLAAKDNISVICEFFNAYSADGKMSRSKLDGLVSKLRQKAQGEVDENNQWWYVHVADIVSIWGTQGADAGANSMGLTEGECDDCPTTVHLDFRTQKWGFDKITKVNAPGHPDYYAGEWIAGVGWRTDALTDRANQCQIAMACREITITDFDALAVGFKNVVSDGFVGNSVGAFNSGVEEFMVPQGADPVNYHNVHHGQTYVTDTPQLYVGAGFSGAHVDGCYTVLQEVDITFTGPVPAAWADAIE